MATKKRKKSSATFYFPAKSRVRKPNLNIDKETAREIWGVIFGLLAVLVFLALGGQLGTFGKYFYDGTHTLFGKGVYFVPVIFGLLAVAFFASKTVRLDYTRIFGILLIFMGVMGFFHTFLGREDILAGGGYIGLASSIVFVIFLGLIGARVVLFSIALIGVLLVFPISITAFLEKTFAAFGKIFQRGEKKASAKNEPKVITAAAADQKVAADKRRNFETEKKVVRDFSRPLVAKTDDEWEPPHLDLLSSEKSNIVVNEKLLMRKAELIREKLLEFGVDVEMRDIHTGPTVTQFTLKPAEGVKLNKITALKNDLALALAAKSVRIEAPILGKDLVGIEIPNEKRSMVGLREILESKNFADLKGTLRLPLGLDVAGEAVAFDLAGMPHLLMAGATGAGKSVGMNSFLLSLLFQNSPAELKMILIDPKRVELSAFNGIPHLLTPVITDAEKALSALRWATAEMMRRYSEMSDKGYRNIAEYNAGEKEKMPKIVIVIDELADLMMRQLKKETETVICRIAQMARAVGMHLIIATQRPSVDVITGLIKANIPARISYAVTSAIDSRTILDSVGAEDLLGKGDLLFTNANIPKPLRVQGVLVTSEEIDRVINRIKLTASPEFDDAILAEAKPAGSGFSGGSGEGDDDDLLEEATEIVRSSRKASASLLQRRLSVGYARAARLLDIMEERGFIGPARGAKPRDIFL